ncbi:hypothetical protein C8R44DRAFT_768671 [Mycena epipterygia]|nr:hypothetical protein C8R44DRAFT_768671 [Mycena epipterygia]
MSSISTFFPIHVRYHAELSWKHSLTVVWIRDVRRVRASSLEVERTGAEEGIWLG